MKDFDSKIYHKILLAVNPSNRSLAWLWTDCRRVSKCFKTLIEKIFVDNELEKMELSIVGGERGSFERGDSRR
jgi:hypothetical protein